jgi:hypothetical protein
MFDNCHEGALNHGDFSGESLRVAVMVRWQARAGPRPVARELNTYCQLKPTTMKFLFRFFTRNMGRILQAVALYQFLAPLFKRKEKDSTTSTFREVKTFKTGR